MGKFHARKEKTPYSGTRVRRVHVPEGASGVANGSVTEPHPHQVFHAVAFILAGTRCCRLHRPLAFSHARMAARLLRRLRKLPLAHVVASAHAAYADAQVFVGRVHCVRDPLLRSAPALSTSTLQNQRRRTPGDHLGRGGFAPPCNPPTPAEGSRGLRWGFWKETARDD